jgi:cyanoexosortase A
MSHGHVTHWRLLLSKPVFWLVVLATALMILSIQLPFRLTGSFDHLSFHLIFWLAAVSLIWQKRDRLVLESDVFSSVLGLVLIGIVLSQSWFARGDANVLFDIAPVFSVLGLALLASGVRHILQFQRELLIVAISVLPAHNIPGFLDRFSSFSLLAAKFITVLLWYAGFDVTRQGVTVILPTGAIEINTGCSGINAMLLLFQLSLLFVLYVRVPLSTALWLPGLSVAIAFSVNGLRLVLMALLVAYSDKNSFEYWHGSEGAQIFSLISMLLFSGVCQRLWPLSKSAIDPEVKS